MFKRLLNHYSRRPKKNRLFLIGASIILLIALIPTVYLSFKARKADAVWYNDNYAFRKKFTFTHNADITSDRRLDITIDTTPFTTDQMQADCDDTRFTDINGRELRFQEVSGCDSASTVYDIVLPATFNGSNAFYMYYGNPTAANASEDVSATTDLGTPSGNNVTAASEEKAPAPIAYWKFDEGTNNTCSGGTNDACDTTTSQNDAAFSGPTWETEEKCVSGKCVLINSTDTILKSTNASLVMSSSYSISAWVKLNAYVDDSPIVIKRQGSSQWNYYFDTDSDGTIFVGMYDGSTFVSSGLNTGRVLEKSKWYYVTAVFDDSANTLTTYIDGVQNTQATGITGTPQTSSPGDLSIGGNAGSAVMDGYLDDLKIYKFALSAAQIKAQYAAKTSGEGASAVIGASQQNILNNDLVGYWKLDETSAGSNAVDSSGIGTTLTNTNTATFLGAKLNFGTDLESGSSQYFLAADNANLSLTGSLTLSAWIKPETVSSGTYNIISKWDGSNESYRIMQNADEIRIEINSSGNYVETSSSNLATGTWYHVVGVYNATFGTARVYINGVEATTSTTGTIPTSIGDDAGRLQIGAEDSTGGATGFYDGVIDDARIYKRAFNGREVRLLYGWGPDPVGYWNFDENTGTSTLYDRSGNSNTGTMTNIAATAWVPGKFGSALDFDGTSYVQVGTGASINVEVPITLSAWVYPTSTAAFQDIITDRDGATSDVQYALRINNGTDLEYYFHDGSAFREYIQTSVVTLNAWNHIAASNDGTNIILYVNGKPVLTTTTAFNPDTSAEVTQISGYDGTNERFTGKIDEAKIYNYARTPGQVVEDMNGNHPVGGSPVGSQLAYLAFDEQQGQTANDRSADATYDATLGASGSSSTDDPTWKTHTSCKINGCLSFDGGDFTRITSRTGPPGGFSVSAWVNPNVVNTTQVIASQYGTNAYFQFFASNTDIVFRIHQTKDTIMIGRIATGALTSGSWQHITATWDGTTSASGIKIYKNGRRVDDTNNNAGSFTAASTASNAIDIGGQDGGAFWNGFIDEVKFYSSGLTQEQVLIDMNANAAVNISTGTTEQSQLSDTSVPILIWNLDENTGTTTNDTSGNGLNGSLTSSAPTWSPGKYGSGLTFDSAGSQTASIADANTGGNLDFAGSDSFTIEVWFNHSVASATDGIINKFAALTNGGYEIYMEADGDITCGIDGDATSFPQYSVTSTAATYDDGKWHQVTCVKSGSSTLSLYIDGVFITSTSISSIDLSNDRPLTLGAATNGSFWNGGLDHAVIYRTARTATQVAYDYNRGRPVAWWKYDECQGTTAYDASGNSSNNGTITPGDTSGDNDTAGTCVSGTTTEMWNDGATGKFNASLDFDGTNDYVAGPNIAETTAGSIALWVKADTLDNGIFTNGGIGNLNISLSVTSGGAINLDLNDGDWLTATGPTTISTGTWNHIVATWNGTNIQVYLNGRPGTAVAQGSPSSGGNGWDFGRSSITGSFDYFDGLIDDVRVYNYALAATQVRKLMTDDAAARFGPATGQP
jgi:hypothetical protein